jgi:hypothetical protein
MSHTIRRFAFALILAVLAGNAAQAASRYQPARSVPQLGMFSAVWNWLAHLLPNAPVTTSQTKAGCGMDPNGRCIPVTPSTVEAGCGMDPDGVPRCAPSAGLREAGGMMGPDGVR